jgi:NADP-dependent 3-hydroxy acid dehydrogenase YdfG
VRSSIDRYDMATTPDFSVAGKHVLITGGTGGIGGAFAKAFLDHGAHVIVADLAARRMGPIRAFDTSRWTCATMLQLKHLPYELKSSTW